MEIVNRLTPPRAFCQQTKTRLTSQRKVNAKRMRNTYETHWPCNEEVCIFPNEYVERLENVFRKIVECKDLRKLFANNTFSECEHLKHVHKFDDVTYDERNECDHENHIRKSGKAKRNLLLKNCLKCLVLSPDINPLITR